MQLKNTLLILTLALLYPATLTAQCERLWLAENELWITNAQGTRFVLSDPAGVMMPRWSPQRDRIAYARMFDFENDEYSALRIVDGTGSTLRSLPIPAAAGITAVEQLGWRDDDHVFMEGHVNPSTSKYLEWEVSTGRLVAEKLGSWFAVSPDGRSLAQRAHVPHGAPAPYDSATLLISDTSVYPTSDDQTYHQFVGAFSWSADSQHLAVIDFVDERPELVVATPAANAIRRVPLGDLRPRGLSWAGDKLLISAESGDWQAELASGTLLRATPLTNKVEDVAPATLRTALRDTPARVADQRCHQQPLQ